MDARADSKATAPLPPTHHAARARPDDHLTPQICVSPTLRVARCAHVQGHVVAETEVALQPGYRDMQPPRTTDFSIARLLAADDPIPLAANPAAATAPSGESEATDQRHATPPHEYEWLRCSRYQPPRLPRTRRRAGALQRRAGRLPRIPFTPEQLATMEAAFASDHYLRATRAAELAAAMKLPPLKVKVWFQNRRARQKREEKILSVSSPQQDLRCSSRLQIQ
ncbi:Homeobox protein H17 [Gryllus bimaculatus]|nr:Homeobox protein H17 [Gryllus bimaculatus]